MLPWFSVGIPSMTKVDALSLSPFGRSGDTLRFSTGPPVLLMERFSASSPRTSVMFWERVNDGAGGMIRICTLVLLVPPELVAVKL